MQGVSTRVLRHRELSRVRLPDVLLVRVVLGGDHHAVSHQEGRVEANTKLTNQVTGLERKQVCQNIGFKYWQFIVDERIN